MVRNITLLLIGMLLAMAPQSQHLQQSPPLKSDDSDRPFLAIWRDNDGYSIKQQAPYLRVAFWNDGRVLFSQDPVQWGHALLQGRIAPYRVERLQKALLETGVFDLKGHCYLGPDLPIDCILVDVGKKQQMLYWLENQMSWMDAPHRAEFARIWRMINNLALVACPDQFAASTEVFNRPPKSWYLKDPIQSE